LNFPLNEQIPVRRLSNAFGWRGQRAINEFHTTQESNFWFHFDSFSTYEEMITKIGVFQLPN
jgi:hypothetical protein